MSQSSLLARLLVMLASLAFSFPVWAVQDLPEPSLFGDTEQIPEKTPGHEGPKEPPTWDIRLGVLANYSADYEGSKDYEFGLGPYIRVSWKDRIIWRGKSLSANFIRSKNWLAGPVLKLRGSRDEDENSALRGLGDVDTSVEMGAQVRYRRGPFRAKASIVQDVADGHGGALAQFGAGIQFPTDEPWFLAMLTTSVASDDYVDSYFGVSASQSAASTLPQFNADAGFKDIGIVISTRLPIYKGLSAAAIARYWRLIGDAADSPVIGDENQFLVGVGLIYRF